MAHDGWDGTGAHTRMPATGETVNGTRFSVPKGAKSMTINCPDLVGGATTIKLQALVYPLDDQVADVWRDVSVFNLADGTLVALDGIPEAAATVLPISATGGGVLRFVASADQTSAPITIPVFFSSH